VEKKGEKKELYAFDENTKDQQHIRYYQAQLGNIISYGKCSGVQTEESDQEQ
jgi:hypothetical protein